MISSVFHQPLSPTSTAPMSTVPQKVMHHSGQFWASTATRSPFAMPRPSSASLTEFDCAMKSAKVMRRSP